MNLKQRKGITLIALIITIIVLLILAGISISALTNQGLFSQAENAKKTTENAQIEEKETLADYETTIGEYVEGTREQITVDKAEYEQLKAKVATMDTRLATMETKINFTTPILLTTASLPNSNSTARQAGTYNASSSQYTKTDSEDLLKYLTFEEGKGWTVKKSGFYYFSIRGTNLYSGTSGFVESYVLINGVRHIATNEYMDPTDSNSHSSAQMTMYLKENDILDFSYVIGAKGSWSTATFIVYAMFE